jgi:hypothetical protein
MRKSWFIVLITTAVLLAACAQAKATAPAEKPVATEDPKAVKMECQVVSLEPTQGPTEASAFPPPSKDDWVLGKNPNASLTIIEYSDFQ